MDMAVQIALPKTAEEFDRWVLLPENAGRDYEFIAGEVREVVSNPFSSETAANILAEILTYAKKHKLGRVTGADGGYWIAGERYIPDVAFTRFERQPQPSHDAYNTVPPDLVVEVMLPIGRLLDSIAKIANYLLEGCVVWLVNPQTSQVSVMAPGQPAQKLGIGDTLDGGALLPGFRLPVREIFPQAADG
jgi:Uma2 family endonuclease